MAADFIPVRSKENIDDKEEREGERKSEPTDGGFGKASTMPVLQKPVWKEHRPPKHLSRVTVGALAGGTIISAPKDEKTGDIVDRVGLSGGDRCSPTGTPIRCSNLRLRRCLKAAEHQPLVSRLNSADSVWSFYADLTDVRVMMPSPSRASPSLHPEQGRRYLRGSDGDDFNPPQPSNDTAKEKKVRDVGLEMLGALFVNSRSNKRGTSRLARRGKNANHGLLCLRVTLTRTDTGTIINLSHMCLW
ncbi:unnamed protein product [Tetraodon nigroviridis]|uniref:(spotted green pufferfish) hypothetical protein n=1 Tax=Tetraodon nigroviridis TaxID=99883 RepID=Q4RFI6_TETNG|nr:unnamed protein product [Tetraodon nigroviridis]